MVGTIQTITSNIVPTLIGLGATGLVWLFVFPIRTLFTDLRKEWYAAAEKLAAVEKELQVQRTTCLTTLTAQGERQIEILEKTSTILDAMHLSQVEMTGFMKGRN